MSVVRGLRAATAAGLVAAGLVASSADGAPVASCHGPTSQPPNVGSEANGLAGVAVTSACNAWAVGSYSKGTTTLTLIEHWNGKAWKVQRSRNAGPDVNELLGVAATSANDAWAVGSYGAPGSQRTLVEHWNGKAWRVQKSPSPGSSANLRGVAATSATNAWAVGSYGAPGSQRTLVEHWNGKAWRVQNSPSPGSSPNLSGVAAASATNAWAVGSYGTGAGAVRTLVERWNGKAWKVQKSPSPGGGNYTSFTSLFGVAATSSNNAWAVGYYDNASTTIQRLVEHWNGKAWKVQKSRELSTADNALYGVAAVSASDAWAVGYYLPDSTEKTPREETLVERWNGKAWRIQPSPSPGGVYTTNDLSSVAVTSPNSVWAVGSYQNTSTTPGQNLALQWNGTSWSP